MIGKLKGKIDTICEDYIILDVNGVGYRVFCSAKVLTNIKVNEEKTFIVNTIVRDDAILLFGFISSSEKKWFDSLCKINGIGNKMALNIIGSLTGNEIISAIDTDDEKRFCAVPGIGSKLASRIVMELKNMRKKLETDDTQILDTIPKEETFTNKDTRLKDALSALENLGYQRNTCYGIIATLLKEKKDIVLESLITETLKKINNF
ncbi:MAG: Holliday junction branch migration protein RuvA [Rickettsiales bacterium]|jgi:Holliday junction DNA helicase RuvA|nr:Holliday junction branch migration protein RuvA [Rickettsiales bacterium]